MLFSLLLISNKIGKEDTSFCSTAVNNSHEIFVDMDAEKPEIQAPRPQLELNSVKS